MWGTHMLMADLAKKEMSSELLTVIDGKKMDYNPRHSSNAVLDISRC